MLILIASFVTFAGIILLMSHLEPQTRRRMSGQWRGRLDLLVHGTIIILFHGTFAGLVQAELAGIMFSIYLRFYAYAYGYEFKDESGRWMLMAGKWQ